MTEAEALQSHLRRRDAQIRVDVSDEGKRQIEQRPRGALAVEQEGLRARGFRVWRQVECMERQCGANQRTLAGEIEHERASRFVAVDHDLGVLDGKGLPRPIDLTFDGSGVETVGGRNRQAEPARNTP